MLSIFNTSTAFSPYLCKPMAVKKIMYFAVLLVCLAAVPFTAQTTDAAGRKQGYWKKKGDNGKLLYEGEFKDDKPVGKFKYYYPNDSIKAILHFRNGGASALAYLFHMNGKRMAVGKYIGKETKDSTWIYYDEKGVMISKDEYKAGKKHGTCYVYLPDGKLSEVRNYKDDQLNGEFKDYFDGTNLRCKGTYLEGKMEGRVAYYYPNGVEVAAGFYRNGLKVGPWIYRTESGKVREKELYRNGVLASPKETEEFFSKHAEPTTAGPAGTAPAPSPVKAPEKKPAETKKAK